MARRSLASPSTSYSAESQERTKGSEPNLARRRGRGRSESAAVGVRPGGGRGQTEFAVFPAGRAPDVQPGPGRRAPRPNPADPVRSARGAIRPSSDPSSAAGRDHGHHRHSVRANGCESGHAAEGTVSYVPRTDSEWHAALCRGGPRSCARRGPRPVGGRREAVAAGLPDGEAGRAGRVDGPTGLSGTWPREGDEAAGRPAGPAGNGRRNRPDRLSGRVCAPNARGGREGGVWLTVANSRYVPGYCYAVQKAGFKAPPDQADLDPTHEALQLAEPFREAARLAEVRPRGQDFMRRMESAERRAIRLRDGLQGYAKDPLTELRKEVERGLRGRE